MTTAYMNGRIYTMRAENDVCSAFVVEDGKFLYCGTDEEAKRLAPGCEVIDLEGAPVLPGMIDTHQHVLSYARDLLKLNLKDARSLEELKQMIHRKAESVPAGQWILGTGFDQERFSGAHVLPTRADLDEACPNNPIIITRYCLHINVANSMALERGGIGRGFLPKVANTVEFGADGEPTGVLWDQAAADIVAEIPDPLATQEAKKNAVEAAFRELNKCGLTGVHTIQGKHCDLFEYTDVYQDLADEGRLTARVYLGFDEFPGCSIRTGLGNEMVKYGFFKIYTDGSMGARSAYLTEPYEDDPTQIGVTNYTQVELDSMIMEAWNRNIQTGVHVIGDRSVEMLVESIEKANAARPRPDARFRMIHMSLLNPNIVERLINLPVILDIQPMFVSTNVRWSETRVGHERARYHYCWRKLIDAGLMLTAGSDSPIETFNPMKGTYAIVTRQGLDGYPEGGWFPEERVTVYEAISMYTRNAAYVSFEENLKGTIEPGKLADFVVLNEDVFRTPPERIKDITVKKTYLGGRLVYADSRGGA